MRIERIISMWFVLLFGLNYLKKIEIFKGDATDGAKKSNDSIWLKKNKRKEKEWLRWKGRFVVESIIGKMIELKNILSLVVTVC